MLASAAAAPVSRLRQAAQASAPDLSRDDIEISSD
jgi:hypothetical protein